MKNLEHKKDTNSYMQLCMDLEGKEKVYLMVPTYWDAVHKCWMGFVKTPQSRKILHSQGKDSFELQNNFNVILTKALKSEIAEEVFSMFKPLEYWESRL